MAAALALLLAPLRAEQRPVPPLVVQAQRQAAQHQLSWQRTASSVLLSSCAGPPQAHVAPAFLLRALRQAPAPKRLWPWP